MHDDELVMVTQQRRRVIDNVPYFELPSKLAYIKHPDGATQTETGGGEAVAN